jgi:hypothetical protein
VLPITRRPFASEPLKLMVAIRGFEFEVSTRVCRNVIETSNSPH